METQTFIAAAAFGLEGLAARECKRLGLSAAAENGGARFQGSFEDAFRANLCLRTADRVLLVLAEREVYTFEDLYQLMNGIPWERYAAPDANLHISGKCVRSQLMSVRDCQAVGKKAAVERLMRAHHTRRAPETGVEYPVHIDIVNNVARIALDMSGDALNRRGYRTWNGEAPLRETLAAALVELSPWKPHLPLYDACCGTGTLLIEAAMRAAHRAPGIHRSFACEQFSFMSAERMQAIRTQCAAEEKNDVSFNIAGSDIDADALTLCRKHIDQAGYTGRIEVSRQDLRTLQLPPSEPGVFLMNPPYGERLSDQNGARELYREMGKMYSRHPGWALCAITADPAFERWFGRRADQKRRLYNGRLECDFYIFKA